jgi:drug/metabolite transporter (DMT)-like permease
MMALDARGARRPLIPVSLRWGVGLAFATALVSGVSIFVNGFAVRQLPDPAVYTALKNAIAAALLVGAAALVVRPADVRALDRRAWTGLAVVGIVGGGIPFLLFFAGLAQASAPSAAFIHKTLFVWVALLAVPLLGERLGWLQVGALVVLLGGQALALPPTDVRWGSGETMIAAATLLWAVEAVLVRRLLATVPSPVLAAGRLGIGLLVLFGYLAATGRIGVLGTLSAEAWGWVVLTGGLLAGYVGTWYAALRRAPAAVVTSALVVGAPITAVLQLLASGAVPGAPVVGGYALVAAAVGIVALTTVRRRETEPSR